MISSCEFFDNSILRCYLFFRENKSKNLKFYVCVSYAFDI